MNVSLYYLIALVFSLLMQRRPPKSTLFPTRRSSDLAWHRHQSSSSSASRSSRTSTAAISSGSRARSRSEEHTSELQSHHDLVCRLLLEKKKTLNHFGY